MTIVRSFHVVEMSNCVLFAFACAVLFISGIAHAKTPGGCIEGPLHKPSPGPEGPSYAECFPWKDDACCKASFTVELAKHRVQNLYNMTWHHCGNLSQKCEAFIKNEECFWQCEPSLIKWHTAKGAVNRVPICASYCNEWFDACKSDMTCVQDWMVGFNYTSSSYICPIQSTCRTFQEIYKGGEGLCNTMWGSSFQYESSSNCMVMNFTGPNPNTKVTVTSGSKSLLRAMHNCFILVSHVVLFFVLN